MPRISTSGVQSVDTSRVDQAEAFRRQEAMRREQLQQQAIAQQLQAQLAREGLDVQREGLGMKRELGMAEIGARRDMPGLSADAALRQQGGTGMDLMQAEMGGQERLAHIGNLPAMEQLRMEQTMRALQMSQELEQAYRTGAIDAGTYQMMRDRILGGDQPQAAQPTAPAEPQQVQPQSVHLGGPRLGGESPLDPMERALQEQIQARGAGSGAAPSVAPTVTEPPQETERLTPQGVGDGMRQLALQNMVDAEDRELLLERAMQLFVVGSELARGPALSVAQTDSKNKMMDAIQQFAQINDKTARSAMDFLADIAGQVEMGEMTAQQQLESVRQLSDRMRRVAELRAEVLSIVADDPERIAQSGANIGSVMDLDLADENASQILRSMRDAMKVDQDERLKQLRRQERQERRRDTVQRSHRDLQAAGAIPQSGPPQVPQTGAWPGVEEALRRSIEQGLQQQRSAQ